MAEAVGEVGRVLASEDAAARAQQGGYGGSGRSNSELLRSIDTRSATSAADKAILMDRYMTQSLQGLSRGELQAVLSDEADDPRRRKVAERLLGMEGSSVRDEL